jgi:hypothetical protein
MEGREVSEVRPRRFYANLVLFLILVMAIAHVIGEWGYVLPFVYPIGVER